MHLKLGLEHEVKLKSLGLTYIKYADYIYLPIAEIKKNYKQLQETININNFIRFDELVFSAEFEILKEVI